jgi:hypothetical protein
MINLNLRDKEELLINYNALSVPKVAAPLVVLNQNGKTKTDIQNITNLEKQIIEKTGKLDVMHNQTDKLQSELEIQLDQFKNYTFDSGGTDEVSQRLDKIKDDQITYLSYYYGYTVSLAKDSRIYLENSIATKEVVKADMKTLKDALSIT